MLDLYVFKRLAEVREIKDRWLTEYNGERSHESLGNLTHDEYAAVNQEPENSTFIRH